MAWVAARVAKPLASDSEIERTATAAACDAFRWTTTVGGKEAEDKATAI